MVTLKEIAEAAGVSVMTVSRVINNVPAKVSEETRARIMDIISERGYVPNSFARSLSSRSSRLVALVANGGNNVLRSPYSASMVGHISSFVQERGFSLMLFTVDDDYEDVTRRLRTWNVAGAIFLGLFDSALKRIRKDNQIPLVFTDSYSTERQLTNVGIDDYHGGEIAAKHLIDNGHTKLAFVGRSAESPVLRERMRGFMDACQERGVTLLEERTLPDNPPADEIERVLLKASDPPTGVFATSDFVALQIISVLSDHGLRVPEDISVMGFDNLELGAISRPKLTTIKQDIEKKAQLAVELLFEHIQKPGTPAQNMILDVFLVERASVGRLKNT
ncbi:MAG: LacI family transcriptional regulator [Clostridiales bacterium]|nr:LacI family transcriptional regulator [Clostridiales bacterium]